MPRFWKIAALTFSAVLLVLLAALAWWLPSNEALASRVAQAGTKALGVQVTVGALDWQLLPRPRVEVRDVATVQPRPLQLQRLAIEPRLLPLLRGRVEIDRVVLDGGTMVQRSLRGLGRAEGVPAAAGAMPAVEVARVEFRGLTWISRSDVPVVYAGEVDLDPGLRLRQATVRRPGLAPATDLVVTRENDDDAASTAGSAASTTGTAGTQRFALRLRLAGGEANGQARIEPTAGGGLRLQGALSPRGVEVQAALAAFNRNSPIAGVAQGETTLSAEGDNALALAQGLRTETRFEMQPATALRFDLTRALKTVGREHAGQTRLDRLRGRVESQNTPDGTVLRFLDLEARAGTFSASGEARLQDRRLQARAAVDLVDGVIGIPVTIAGPLGNLKVTVSRAPLVGAAVGTAVLPGVGTAIGAAIGRLFSEPEVPAPDAPAPKPRASKPSAPKPPAPKSPTTKSPTPKP